MSRDTRTLRAPSLRRYEDPATSRDPRVRAVVEGLSQVDYAPVPRPEFRNELRAQLVAVTERIIAESAPAAVTATAEATTAAAPVRSRRSFGRPLGMATAVVAALALLLGGAVWKSQSSLPGDSLYGLKRTSEDVQLSMSSGSDKGHEYLSQASTRVQEAQDLVGTTSAMASGGGVLADGVSPQTAKLISDTLRSADSDLTSGSTLLNDEAVRSHSAAPLDVMTNWAPSQLEALHTLAAAVPGTALQKQATSSWSLVNNANGRAKALKPDIARDCKTGGADKFGPQPCGSTLPTSTSTSSPVPGHRTRPGMSATPKRHGNSAGSTAGARSGGSQRSQHGAAATSGATPSPGTSTPGLPIPKLPKASLPKAPIKIDSCGAHASVGPVGVNLGTCSGS